VSKILKNTATHKMLTQRFYANQAEVTTHSSDYSRKISITSKPDSLTF